MELDEMEGPFQTKPFYDSVILTLHLHCSASGNQGFLGLETTELGFVTQTMNHKARCTGELGSLLWQFLLKA